MKIMRMRSERSEIEDMKKGGEHYQYSESTIKGFENLIYLVVFQASRIWTLCECAVGNQICD